MSEKAGFGIRGNRLSGPGKGWLLVSAVRLEATPQAVEMMMLPAGILDFDNG